MGMWGRTPPRRRRSDDVRDPFQARQRHHRPPAHHSAGAASLRSASIRSCQSSPARRKRSTTSSSSATCVRPSNRALASSQLMNSASSSMGGLSGSFKASAVIAASSSGVISALARLVFSKTSAWRARALSIALRSAVDIHAPFPIIRLAQGYNAHNGASHREHNHVQSTADEADRNDPLLSVIASIIEPIDGRLEVEGFRSVEGQAPLIVVPRRFLRIPVKFGGTSDWKLQIAPRRKAARTAFLRHPASNIHRLHPIGEATISVSHP